MPWTKLFCFFFSEDLSESMILITEKLTKLHGKKEEIRPGLVNAN